MPYKLYACGSNGKYQLGAIHDDDLDKLECVFETSTEIKSIACGGNHTLVLLTNGEVYATGDNSYGQCGISKYGLGDGESNVKGFELVPKVNGKDWCLVSAGYEFSVLVNEDSDIYSCGFGLKGELGVGLKVSKSVDVDVDVDVDGVTPTLTKLSWDYGDKIKIKSIRSCLDHTVILLEDGSAYGWGNARNGKLGEGQESKLWIPTKIPLEDKVVKVETARDFTVFKLQNGEILLLGKDRYDIQSQLLPSVTTSSSVIIDFKAMWSSLHLVTCSKDIISIGNNSHSQLLQIPSHVTFSLFEVGSEHGLILTDEGEVQSWGWGEHGNCGVVTMQKRPGSETDDTDSFNYLNTIFKESATEKVKLIKGGCATTWIATYTESI